MKFIPMPMNRPTPLKLSTLAVVSLMMTVPVQAQKSQMAIAIHGGAGVIERSKLSPEREAEIRKDLETAVRSGYAKLSAGSSSLDAVTTAVIALEDSPHFNAGRGAVFTHEGINELDAAIMDGSKRQAGAVTGVRRIKNPVLLARAVMEQSNHVMLTGNGAEQFALSIGMGFVSPSYFKTEERWKALQEAKRLEKLQASTALSNRSYFGTVGAVALDASGALAAATSTGGMTNKRFGRVGDAPVIGAGTFADLSCAVSATGHGEFFIRSVVAYDICAKSKYLKQSVSDSATQVINSELKTIGGEGGVITIDREGKIAMPFNSEGMYRASIDVDGKVKVEIF